MDPSKRVEALRTVLTPSQAIDAIWHAHQDVIGGPCPVNLLGILTAQSALETARWNSMWCFNFGNLRGPGQDGAWTSIHGADEIVDGHEEMGPEVEAGFAAFQDRYEGARAFVRFLGTASHPPHPNRYQGAWNAATAGDVSAYVSELKKQGYFTANEDKYREGVQDTWNWLKLEPLPTFIAYLSAEPTSL